MEILIILDNKKVFDREIKLKPLIIKGSVLTLLVIVVVIGISNPVSASIEPKDFDTRMMEYKDIIDVTLEYTYKLTTTGVKELVTTMDQEVSSGKVPILKPFTIENQKAFLYQFADECKNSKDFGVQGVKFIFDTIKTLI